MTRWGVSIGLFALLATLVGAQGPQPSDGEAVKRMKFFQRNRALVEELVRRSLDLTRQADPLERVKVSNAVVRKLAEEIREAARRHDRARVAELGGHLEAVLTHGLMPNYSAARAIATPNSREEQRLFAEHAETARAVGTAEEELRDDAAAQQVLQALGAAQNALRRAVGK